MSAEEMLRRAAKTLREHADPLITSHRDYRRLLTDPAVFAALAAWLDAAAPMLEEFMPADWTETDEAALAVARAILREQS